MYPHAPAPPHALPKSRHPTLPTETARSEVRFLSFLQRATLRPAEKKRAAEKAGEATAVTTVATCDREAHRQDLGCRRQQSLEGAVALTSSPSPPPPPPPPLLPPFPAPMMPSLPQQERSKRQSSAKDAVAGGGGGDLGDDGVGSGGGGIGGGGDDTPDNFLSVITRARGIRSNESNVFGA